MQRYYTRCKECIDREHEARWMALPRVAWDGHSPVVEWDGDRLWIDPGELLEWVGEQIEAGNSIEDCRFVLAIERKPRAFEMVRYLEDELSEDFDEEQFTEIDRIVNEWLQANRPKCYAASNQAISIESIQRHLDAYNAPPAIREDDRG